MNILHLNAYDSHGGAAIAALRLIEGQRRRGHEAALLVGKKTTALDHVHEVTTGPATLPGPDKPSLVEAMAWQITSRLRTSHADTPFSGDFRRTPVLQHPLTEHADVIHLHWLAGFVSARDIRQLQELGKPIIWTLHDQFPFTGGCHYAFQCPGYEHDCSGCPQIHSDAAVLPKAILARKLHFIEPRRLIVVSPSRWLAECARKSALFRDARIEVVPNGIDVSAWQMTSRIQARTALGISADSIAVLVCSANLGEERKGGAHIHRALQAVRSSQQITDATRARLVVLVAGEGARGTDAGGFTCVPVGSVPAEDPRLRMAYQAADLFALPTLEDNLPNTMLEAMAAGTPVVAYATGGVPDFVQNDVNGRLVTRGDIDQLAAAIVELAMDEPRRRRLGAAAAATAREHFDLPRQVARYDELYAEARTTSPGDTARMAKPIAAGASSLEPSDPAVETLLADPRILRLFANLLLGENAELQRVIAARGGEIRELRTRIASLDSRVRQLRRVGQAAASKGGSDSTLAPHPSGIRIGIFGAGTGGARAWEAAMLVPYAEVAWFSDNNPALHGTSFLGRPVIAPAQIPNAPADRIVIGSIHRDAISAQLRELGVPGERILALDVGNADRDLEQDLVAALEGLAATSPADQ